MSSKSRKTISDGTHKEHKVGRQPPGRADDDSLIDASRTGAFGQGMPGTRPYPSYQNAPGQRRKTQAPGGGSVAGSYQGRGAGADGSHASYLAGAPMGQGPERWNNLSTMEALADLIAKHKFIKPKGGGRLGGMGGG